MVENTPGRPPLRFQHNVCTPCIGARNYQRCGGQRQLQCMFLNAIINFRSQSRRRPNWLPIKISARWESERRSQNSTESEWEREKRLCALATFWSSAHTLTHSLRAAGRILAGDTYTHTHSWELHSMNELGSNEWRTWMRCRGLFQPSQGPCWNFPTTWYIELCDNYYSPGRIFNTFKNKWEKSAGD